ncbi:MAG: hypothetical protein KGJ80_05925 [Chloroflexota bacterium]|nr:hypothetical protein [Chloroflexota bacterium]
MENELRLTDPGAARDAGFIERVKAAVGLPADAQLELQSAAQSAGGERIVKYAAPVLKLDGAEFGAANGVVVDERVTVSLRFDARGALASSEVAPIDERHFHLVKAQVSKLAAADEIYLAAPGESIDTDALRARRKPWYVETDARGRKRLKRAYVA